MARTYTPGNASNQGSLPAIAATGATWDGQQLVIVQTAAGETLYTLARNANRDVYPSQRQPAGYADLRDRQSRGRDLGRATACHCGHHRRRTLDPSPQH